MELRRVLAVDDSPVVLNLLRCHLQTRAEVLVASSGEAGLVTAQAARPDLVFLDQALPGMQGIDLVLGHGTRGCA